jgi:hypothetical protein
MHELLDERVDRTFASHGALRIPARVDACQRPRGIRAAAHAELAAAPREEAGHRAGRLVFLTRFHPSNAYLDEVADCYAAQDLVPDPLPADGDEFIERRAVPWSAAVAMALDGEITESVSTVAILQYVARPPDRS